MSNDNAKKRLMNIMSGKFKTTVIGSLATFEDHFGYLWGHGKDEEELNEDELYFRNIWADAREELLDKGNHNARVAQNEISQYTISSNRYITNFKPRNN